ncbi:hypothetical protein GN244_ATG08835 [Phytophthora infestans]|uniref:Uncharacterized protein n=1 Tax=Phytophthora infestans TaxID=4787 RepID=A0A833WK40_PHYIN|nr:hypothetical protein GN244_ATG08835 [Phytophthora infestans]
MQAASAEPAVKLEKTHLNTDPELMQLRSEVAELRHHAASTAQMMKDMESMRVQFANMMAKQPQLHAELAELRAHAKVAPQLYAEVNQLKASLQAARTGASA